jgi:hypothetical protein
MSYRPFRNIGRLVVAACAVSFGVVGLNAQSTAAGSSGPSPSRVDVFLGYSYFGAHGQVKPAGLPYSAINQGTLDSGAYFFTKYVGAEGVFVANPDGYNDGAYAAYAGPIFRAPMQNFTLFAHGLAGATKLNGPDQTCYAPPAGFGCLTQEHEPYTWGPSLIVGGGMDYDLPFFNHHFGVRLFEADYRYIHADYGPSVTVPTPGVLGGRTNLGVAELSTGILMHFGSFAPPVPITYACAVTPPGTIYPGDVVTVTGTASNVPSKKTPAYTWTADSGPITSTSNVAAIDTKSLSAGTYTVKGHVMTGPKPYEMADCSVPFTVTAYQPPTIGCSANPSTVNAGEPSTITAVGVSPQNRPLTYSYSASAGAISGNTSTATLSTTGVAPGTTISVTCNVVDDKGQTASQQTTVTIQRVVAPPAPVTQSLCTISFDRDKKRPTRVDNEAKACLDDIALNAQRQADAKLAITGNSAPVEVRGKHGKKEDVTMKYASERAVNEKAYLVEEKGIDASRISVYTGTAGTDTSATTLIPPGATLDSTGLTRVDESAVKAVPRTPVKHKK